MPPSEASIAPGGRDHHKIPETLPPAPNIESPQPADISPTVGPKDFLVPPPRTIAAANDDFVHLFINSFHVIKHNPSE
jgi:hypothetical protein